MFSAIRIGDKIVNNFNDLNLPRAVGAVRALIADPDDTAQAFRVIEALAGGAPARNMERFAATDVGRRVLAERRSLVAVLSDRQRLLALDEGSLGRAYLRFLDEEGISAAGLVEASVLGAGRVEAPQEASSDREVFDSWMRDTHDLWHTVTGYRGDLIGEASLLAFSFAQTRHPGVGLIVLGALLRTTALGRGLGAQSNEVEPAAAIDTAAIRRMMVQGLWRGMRAQWLVAQDWEALLCQPLSEVRLKLGVGEAPRYTPLRSSDIAPQRAAA